MQHAQQDGANSPQVSSRTLVGGGGEVLGVPTAVQQRRRGDGPEALLNGSPKSEGELAAD